MGKYFIYKITNILTENNNIPSVYIGQTTDFKRRRHQHLSNSKKEIPRCKISKCIKELGEDKFIWSILEETDCRSKADILERMYIKEYKSIEFGYNMSPGGSISPEGCLSGKKNPRFGDHRTLIEIHGEEKALKLIENMRLRNTNNEILREHMKRRLSIWNPMDDPKSREKVRKSKLAGKNPHSLHYYYVKIGDNKEIKVDSLVECKKITGKSPVYIRMHCDGIEHKNMCIRKVEKNGK